MKRLRPGATAVLWQQLRRAALAVSVLLGVGTAVAAPASATTDAVQCPPAAQMPEPQALQQLMRDARDRGLLWRLEKNGRTSWLYGTIHASRLEWMIPGPTVMKALRDSDALALEINMLDGQVMAELRDAMRARPDAPPLPAPLAQRLEALKHAECAAAELDALRPDAQVISIVALSARRQGLDVAYGVDVTLAGAAAAMQKPVIGLESVQTQLQQVISDDPMQVQETVASALDQLESHKAGAQLTQLAQIWADGRLSLLTHYADWCDCLNTAKERRDFERVVYGRNPGIAQAIAAQIDSGKTLFAAVGALHMIGPKGLPTLLAAQGFRVERVPFEPAR